MNKKRPDQLTAQQGTFKFETSKFFEKLKDALTSLADEDKGSTSRNLIQAFIQKDDSESALLYKIIWIAAGDACINLFKEKFDPNNFKDLGSQVFELRQDIGQHLKDIEFTIDKNFFREPQKHSQVLALRDLFANWLQTVLDLSPKSAEVAVASFPRQFLKALEETDRTDFVKIKEYFNHPIFEALNRNRLQENYHIKLQELYNCTAFGNNALVRLPDLYIEPFFTVFDKLIPEKQKDNFVEPHHRNDTIEIFRRHTGFKKSKKPINIHSFFEEWIYNKKSLVIKNSESDTLLLLGQPGQGKTSFCLRTIYNVLSGTIEAPVFFMRLRDLEGAPINLIEKPLEYLRDEFSKIVFDGDKMVDKDWQGALLILDGLDELYMNKNMTNEQVRTFLNNLKLSIKRLKEYSNPIKLKCIVTSRHNYVPLESYKNDEWLILSLDNLNLEQQQTWLSKYKSFNSDIGTLKYLDELNEKLVILDKGNDKKSQELRNLVNQPILLTMIAESKIPLDLTSTDRAKIYSMMFDTLQNRSWATEQIPVLKRLKQDPKVIKAYRNFLQRLAIHIFQSKEEYVRRSDFDENNTPLNTAFERLKKTFGDAALNIEQVLSSFYFKQVVKEYENNKIDENNNYAFEFLHKSLQEYLVAEGIWTYMQKLGEKDDEDEYKMQKEKAFEEMFNDFFAPKFLTNEVVEYLVELIEDKSNDKQQLLELKIRIKEEFLPYLCENEFLWSYSTKEKKLKKTPLEQSSAMFYGFWTVSSHVAIVNLPYQSSIETANIGKQRDTNLNNGSIIPNNYKSLFADYLILTRRRFSEANLFFNCQDLGIDFFSSNLEGEEHFGRLVELVETRIIKLFRNIKLRGGNFRGIGFSGADLRGIDFSGADLRNTNFSSTNLSFTDMSNADLSGADLSSANLSGAVLRGANLSDTTFRSAKFASKNLNLKSIGIDDAINLELADFRNTIFEGKIHKREDDSYWIEGFSEGVL